MGKDRKAQMSMFGDRRFYVVDAHCHPARFFVGIEVVNGIVEKAPPIVAWTRGKKWDFCEAYFLKRRYRIELCE